ncbi:hypothetical protein [Adhaeribacter pallidiroseus]|uniref:Late embryogenesis abundant protein LEA-2 subgroup domain-containing protein n=1 Tax=Adhaeribacter pallidiroseus TaxID=2072847 RepID=A0A369QT55_9BACT|nr:hypothetical protein [Adhaeribacter pallidiroseus]RDC66387.1 hypothetical protein AHMF7616_05018 [Adhaeribacter pallidiroseus]
MTKYEGVSIITSLIALTISLATIYYQFFYKVQEVQLSIIDTDFNLIDTVSIESRLIYHNRGNQYSTITQNYFVFYQNKENYLNSIKFSNKENTITLNDAYDPLVLIPGEQHLKLVKQKLFFPKVPFSNYKINPKNKIKIGLVISFMNFDGVQTSELIELGWLNLNVYQGIENFHIDFKSKKLEGDVTHASMEM